jgi:phosphoserine phosphatase
VDRGVDLAVEDLLVERADERAGLAESVNEFVPNLVAPRLDLDEVDVLASARERVPDCRRLPEREVRAPGRQSECGASGH